MIPACIVKSEARNQTLRSTAAIALAMGLLASVAGNAQAGDNTATNWSGAYIGILGGYNYQKDHLIEYYTATDTFTGMEYKYSSKGVSGGIKAGYNLQYNQFVYGVEGDFERANITGSFVDPGIGKGVDEVDWQGSIRARMGLAVDNVMIYGTGGVAFASVKNTYTYLPTMTSESFTNFTAGWTAGIGADVAITDNLIGGFEFRHVDYSLKSNVSTVAFPGLTGTQDLSSNAFKFSLSYKF